MLRGRGEGTLNLRDEEIVVEANRPVGRGGRAVSQGDDELGLLLLVATEDRDTGSAVDGKMLASVGESKVENRSVAGNRLDKGSVELPNLKE